MAACDVWKQTHKNFKNVWSSTAATSMLKPQEMFNDQSNAQSADKLVSSSIFLNKEGNCVDSYDNGNGNDDFHKQIVACWNMETNSFDYKLNDYLWRNIFNDLLNQGQVTLSDGEYDSSSESSDDTTFGMLSSDMDEDEDKNYFDNTHFNCIPVLMMEWHQHQYVYDEDGIIGDVFDAHSVVHSDITLYKDELETMCTNDPCTINHGAHSEQQQQQYQIDKLDTENDLPSVPNNSGVFDGIESINSGANSVSVQQQQQVQLNLEIDNGIIFPSGFYSLQYFFADINGMNQDNQISISLLNKLEFVFVKSDNNYVYRPFTIHDDSDSGGEFISLNVLFYILEDLDIEYGDTIGVSSDVKFLFNVNNNNNIPNNQSPSHCAKQRGMIKSIDTISSSHNCGDNTYENEDNAESSWKNYLLQTAQWIADSQDAKYCSMSDFYNDISSCYLQFGDQIGITTTSLERLHLVFFDVDDKKELASAILKVNKKFDCVAPPRFYPLKLLLHKVEELFINYGCLKNMAIGIEISSLNDLKILFCDDSDQTWITNDNLSLLYFENKIKYIHHQSSCKTANNNINNNSNGNNRSSLNFRKKRGRKKKRYKWIVKNQLQHPVSKTFGGSIINSISNVSDYCNTDHINSQVSSDQINVSDSGHKPALNCIKVITARAPPCDPDEKY